MLAGGGGLAPQASLDATLGATPADPSMLQAVRTAHARGAEPRPSSCPVPSRPVPFNGGAPVKGSDVSDEATMEPPPQTAAFIPNPTAFNPSDHDTG